MSYGYDTTPRRVNRHSELSLNRGAGIEDGLGVQRLLDATVELHRLGPDLVRQPGPFQPADTVLAGDGAAKPDRQIHDLAERTLGAVRHRLVSGVVDDQRMGVAVAGMCDDRDHHVAVGRDAIHAPDQVTN